MTKWKYSKPIKVCSCPCYVELANDSLIPRNCIFGNSRTPKWERVPDEPEQNPEETELPDWCKFGEWIFDANENCYAKVICVGELIELLYRCERDQETRSRQYINDFCKQARLRQHTADEMRQLVGKVLEDKYANLYLATSYLPHRGGLLFGGYYYDAGELLGGGFTINGSPCGVLEHLNDAGEWVE